MICHFDNHKVTKSLWSLSPPEFIFSYDLSWTEKQNGKASADVAQEIMLD